MPAAPQFSVYGKRVVRTVSEFSTGQKVVSALVLAGLILGGFAFARWASKPTYAPLFSNLAASDASAIVDKLNSSGVKYQLTDGGQTIMVPQNDVYAERLKMSTAGLPSAKNTGYALLDQQGVTASQFQQQVAYQRAMEGELDNTIESISGVQTAIVHLAIPQQDVFLDDSQKPSASVLVSTAQGVTLDSQQVQSIVHLVSSSIEGMSSDDVTVVDGNGNLLSAAGSGVSSTIGDSRSSQTQDYDTQEAAALQALLDRTVGPGHAIAQVNATLDLDDTQTTTEKYFSDPTVPPLSVATTTEKYAGSGSGSSGSTGVLGPDNIAVPSGSSTAGTGSGTGYIKTSETADNADGKITQQSTSAPGTVTRQSVAVVVDSSVKGVNMTNLQAAISQAAGIDATRGDTISVTSMPFDTTAAAAAKKELAAANSAASRQQFFGIIKSGSIVLLVLVVLAVAFLMSRKRSAQERTFLDLEMLEQQQRMPVAIGAGGAAGGAVNALPAGPEQGGASPELTQRRDAVHALVERQPDEVAELLRGWLADRRS